MLAVKSLLVVKDLVGTLAARGNRRIGTSVLLDPSLDDCDFLGNLAVGHLVVLSALRSLLPSLPSTFTICVCCSLILESAVGVGTTLSSCLPKTRARANAETSPWTADLGCWAAVSAAVDSGFF